MPARRPTSSVSRGMRTASTLTRQVAIAALEDGVVALSSRYTIAKFQAFDAYTQAANRRRTLAVLLLTPVPSLVASVIPNLLPLQPPQLGVAQNWGYVLHFAATLGLVMFGSVLQIREPNRISRSELSNGEAVLISIVGTIILTMFVSGLGYVWRFPVPFIWLMAYPMYCATFAIAHVIVLRKRLWQGARIGKSIIAFAPAYIVQSLQLIAYMSFSAIFELTSHWGQLALMVMFPVLKQLFRRASHRLLRHLKDDATEVAVTGVEICAVMYQSMIMRSNPSPYTTATLIGIDVLHGLLSVYYFMDKESAVPPKELIGRVRGIVRTKALTFNDADLNSYASRRKTPVAERFNHLRRAPSHATVYPTESLIPSPPSSQAVKIPPDIQLLTQALEAIQAAESILLAEYFEITIPLANGVFFMIASQLESAIYNPKIRPYYEDNALLPPAVLSLGLYTLMQALSLVLMQAVMWYRYRVSALTLLAFVLEQHLWSIQGKLITWLVMFFQFSVLHYGVDFSFKFEYAV